jgi:hypothetical protein
VSSATVERRAYCIAPRLRWGDMEWGRLRMRQGGREGGTKRVVHAKSRISARSACARRRSLEATSLPSTLTLSGSKS